LIANPANRSKNSKLAALTSGMASSGIKSKSLNMYDDFFAEQEALPKKTFLEDNMPFLEI